MTPSKKALGPDHRFLTLLLDLEYLQAEFYLLASRGIGLSDEELGATVEKTIGGHRIDFVNPLVEAFAKGAAQEERDHIKILRELLAETDGGPPAVPALDLKSSFTQVARSAGLCKADQSFDPFLNDCNFLLGAYVLEDVVSSAYLGSLAVIPDQLRRDLLVSILAVEAGQSAMIRFMLLASGLTDQTNAISLYRQRLCQLFGTVYQGGDHGVGTLQRPSISATDGRSMLMSRTQKQCRQILCGNEAGLPGLFFPERLGAPPPLAHLRFKRRYALEMAADGDDGSRLVVSHASEPVTLPALSFSEEHLAGYNIRENISAQPWSETDYVSFAPHVISLSGAVVLGAVGIIAFGDTVLDETLWHVDPRRHRFQLEQDVYSLDAEYIEPLEGVTVSVLVGGAESYWHSLIDSTARLALIPEEIWQQTSHLLLPSTGVQPSKLARLFGVPEHVSLRVVQPAETFRAETLIYPSSLCGVLDYHPSLLNKAFDRLAGNVPDDGATLPKRIYIDRRGSPLRRLVNEDEVVAALPSFTPVRLESLSIEQQIRLFAQAEIIVAPHGAGLANIGFAKPGGVVVELMMDTYCMWCYRRLAAVRGLQYLPVLGRSLEPWKAAENVHVQTWSIEVEAVLAAVAQADALVSKT